MTSRRLPNSRATVALTGGAETDETPCAGRWFVYDILVDLNSGPVWRSAVDEARAICGTCPIMATCLKANREEMWARAVIGRKRPAQSRDSCGSRLGVVAHSKAAETNCEACREFMRNQWIGRKRPEKAITHGTDTGYSRHRKAGEEACEPCKEAHRKMVAVRAARKRESEAAA